MVLAADGLVVTNAHVVSRKGGQSRGALRVTLPGGSETDAELLVKDDSNDVAILKIRPTGGSHIYPIKVGDSKSLRPGQWVMAMGHPWGVSGAAAAGIVIGAGPDLPESPGAGRDWIAVDLALRPGHSGGPLVDHQGRLIGISTMMAGLEVGMAVPAHVIQKFVAQTIAGETGEGQGDAPLV